MPRFYKSITRANKSVLVHRALVEAHIGRKLSRGEVVHHINGNKQDNRIENLVVMTTLDHARHHTVGYRKYSRDYIIEKIREVAKELGRRPKCKEEFEPSTGISHGAVDKMFGSWLSAYSAAMGIPQPNPSGSRHRISEHDLREDLRRVAVEIGHAPAQTEYEKLGRFSCMTIIVRLRVSPRSHAWPDIGAILDAH